MISATGGFEDRSYDVMLRVLEVLFVVGLDVFVLRVGLVSFV